MNDLEQRILQNFFSIGRVFRVIQDHAEKRFRVLVHQLVDGLRIPGAQTLHQLPSIRLFRFHDHLPILRHCGREREIGGRFSRPQGLVTPWIGRMIGCCLVRRH